MQWLRLYHDTAHDPKWRVVAVESDQPLATILGVWSYMLIFASQAKSRGTLEGWNDKVAGAALDLKGDVMASIRQAMQGVVLDGDILTGWDRRQRNSDNVAERVRKHRNNHKPVTPGYDTNAVTEDDVTERNMNVTLPDTDVTLRNGCVTEIPLRAQTTDTDLEKEEPPHTPPLGGRRDLFSEGSESPAKSGRTRRPKVSQPKVYPQNVEEAFSRFKSVYPKRNNPHTWSGDNGAKAKFAMFMGLGTDCEVMIVAATKFAASMKAQGKIGSEGVCDALTWLNQRRWEVWIDEDVNSLPDTSNIHPLRPNQNRYGIDHQVKLPRHAGEVG